MIWLVARRELADHIYSRRFFGALAFFVLLLSAGTWVLAQDQENEREALAPFLDQTRYRESVQGSNAARLVGGGVFVSRPLPPFRGLVRGLEDLSLVAQVKGGNYILYLRRPFVGNPTGRLFADFDLVFAVGVLASLVALFFTYDAVAGERERGTLRLLLAHGAGRSRILAGKFCGAMLALALVLAPSLAAALLVSGVSSISDWGRVGALLGAASLLYGAVFVSLGLLVSCLCSQARSALVAALGLWSMLVWVLPAGGVYLASSLAGAPAWLAVEANINHVRWQAENDGWQEMSGHLAAQGWGDLEQAQWNLDWGSWSDGLLRLYEPVGDEAWGGLARFGSGVMRRQLRAMETRAGRLKADFAVQRRREIEWGRNLARLSPFGAFTFLATDLARAGVGAELEFRRRVERFKGELVGFLDRQLQERGFWDEVDANDLPYFSFEPEAPPFEGAAEAVLLLAYALAAFVGAQAVLRRTAV